MGFYINKGHFFDREDLTLSHEEKEKEESEGKNRAKYGTANSTTSEKGTDNKKNNSSEYNHQYYLENKEKWQIGYGEATEGDPDFDDKNFTDENALGDTDFYAVQGKDGSWTILEENMKWKVPAGVTRDQLHKAVSDISKRDKQKRMSPKEFSSSVTKALEGINKSSSDKKKTEEKKEEESSSSKKKSSSSSGSSKSSSSSGSSKKSSGSSKKSSSKKSSSSSGSSKKSSSGSSKKSSSKKSSTAKTEEEKKAEEEAKKAEEERQKAEQEKALKEAQDYQNMLAEQRQKEQDAQNAVGAEVTEQDLKEAAERVASKSTTKKKTTAKKQNAQYAKHFDEHGAVIKYFGGRRY